MNLKKLLDKLKIEKEESDVRNLSGEYFISDLHFIPFKEIYEKTSMDLLDFVENINPFQSSSKNRKKKIIKWEDLFIDVEEYKYVSFLSKFLFKGRTQSVKNSNLSFLIGAYSFTRSITHLEATRIFNRWFKEDWNIFQDLLSVYRQLPLTKEELPIQHFEDNDNYIDQMLVSNKVENLEIALTSYKVLGESWIAKMNQMEDPDSTRLPRLYNLINSIFSRKGKQVDMIVLPELAISDFSLRLISEQLRNSQMALVTGIDYEIDWVKLTVRNRLAYVLPLEKNGRTIHLQIIQDKVIPAIHESNELWDIGKLKLKAAHSSKFFVKHKGAIISSLICNEFLNIDYRQKLRGAIDALILLEWNQDINTYNSLVEASANDLHCFMIQVNNRLYGDTRVRAPFKLDYKRDIARVRGGEDDYYVVANIDVKSLRLFQMNHVSPTDEKAVFKPVPTGFNMKKNRRLK